MAAVRVSLKTAEPSAFEEEEIWTFLQAVSAFSVQL